MYLRIKVRQAPRKFFLYPQDSSLVCIVLGQHCRTFCKMVTWSLSLCPCKNAVDCIAQWPLYVDSQELFHSALRTGYLCFSRTVTALATILWTLWVGFSNLPIRTRVKFKFVLHPRIQGTFVFLTYASLILGPFIPLSPISSDVESSHSIGSNSLRPHGL